MNVIPDKSELIRDWLGSAPIVYFKLKRALENPDVEFPVLAKIIECDTSLSSRLLRLVNSALYNINPKVESITRALEIVGIGTLQEMALATSVISSFKDIPPDLINMDMFWRHSIAVGILAGEVSIVKSYGHFERRFLQGMLHDIGKLILYKKVPKAAFQALRAEHDQHEDTIVAENLIIGYNHAEVGASLLNSWQLPESLVKAVEHHHDPFQSLNHFYDAALVYTGNALAHEFGWLPGDHIHSEQLNKRILRTLSLDDHECMEIKKSAQRKFNEVVNLFLS